MRTAGEIKTALIKLRFAKRLPLIKIADDSRCSPKQVMEAMKLEASEVIQRRLDAYLDAGQLHVHVKGSRMLFRIERMQNELWREFSARSLPVRDVALLPVDRQIRLMHAMDWRLKKLLRERVKNQTGIEVHFADGQSYWRCRQKVLERSGVQTVSKLRDQRLWERQKKRSISGLVSKK